MISFRKVLRPDTFMPYGPRIYCILLYRSKTVGIVVQKKGEGVIRKQVPLIVAALFSLSDS